MGLTLVIAESSIEPVPREIWNHPAVLKWARRRKRDPGQLILDQNYHYTAMKKLASNSQRGRPDITHLCLLAALGSPLNLDGALKCIVHTRANKKILVDSQVRLPRNTDRFVALLEQLYREGAVPNTGPTLLRMADSDLPQLVSTLNSDLVVALTTEGTPMSMLEIATKLAAKRAPVLLVGGFSEGHFSKQTRALADEAHRIDNRGLDAWVVVARAVYDYERSLRAIDG